MMHDGSSLVIEESTPPPRSQTCTCVHFVAHMKIKKTNNGIVFLVDMPHKCYLPITNKYGQSHASLVVTKDPALQSI